MEASLGANATSVSFDVLGQIVLRPVSIWPQPVLCAGLQSRLSCVLVRIGGLNSAFDGIDQPFQRIPITAIKAGLGRCFCYWDVE